MFSEKYFRCFVIFVRVIVGWLCCRGRAVDLLFGPPLARSTWFNFHHVFNGGVYVEPKNGHKTSIAKREQEFLMLLIVNVA